MGLKSTNPTGMFEKKMIHIKGVGSTAPGRMTNFTNGAVVQQTRNGQGMRRSALQCSCAVHKERVHPPLSASVADVNLGVYLSHTPSLRPEVAHGRVQNPPKQGYPVRDGHLTYI